MPQTVYYYPINDYLTTIRNSRIISYVWKNEKKGK